MFCANLNCAIWCEQLYIISAKYLLGAEAVLYDQVGSQGSLVCGQAPDAEIVNLTVNIICWQDQVFSAPTVQISNI